MISPEKLAHARLAIRSVSVVLLAMLAVHMANVLSNGALLQYGILPRSTDHWYHVFSAPFIHGSYGHLVSNLAGLATFGLLCALRSPRLFVFGSLFIILFSGALVWLSGRDAAHVGASGWVFGLWSLCIALGFLDRRALSILLSLLVMVLYGGMIYGVLPGDPGVSFESHLAGAVAGVVAAYAYVRLSRKRSRRGGANR